MPDTKTVTVEALQNHTSDGVERPLGSLYEVDEVVLDYLIQQKLVRPAAPKSPVKPPPQKK